MYYNTLNIKGQALTKATTKAEKTNALVLKYFQSNPFAQKTPYQVLDILYPDEPFKIHSVKRAMSNLTTKGDLKMLPKKIMERCGSENHLWCLSIKEGQQRLSI